MVAFLLSLLLILPLNYWRGFVAVTLWSWFITPQWPELLPPSIYVAVGVMIMVAIFSPKPASTNTNTSGNIVLAILWPLFLLGVGYLWQWAHLGA
jgi:hypothetical protein